MNFNHGQLHWHDLKVSTEEVKYNKVMESKMSTFTEMVTDCLPAVLSAVLKLCYVLCFEGGSDYAYLR